MPPKKVSLPPNPPPHASQSIPLQYTTFFSVAPLNAKNVASSYLKTEAQTWIARAQSASQSQPHSRKRRIDALRDAADAPDASMNLDDDDDLDANDGEKEAAENTPAHRTIVIHPGSESLRLGRATDLFPIVIPNVIARRAKKSSSSTNQTAGSSNANGTPADASKDEDADVDMSDAAESPNKLDQDGGDASASLRKNPRRSAANAPAQQEPSSDASQDDADAEATPKRSLADGIEAIRNDLRAIMRQEKLRSVGNAKNLAANYNDSSQPEDVPEHNDLFGLQWTDEDAGGDNEVLVGEQALRLACFSQPKTAESKQNQRRQQQQQQQQPQAASVKPLSPPDADRPWTLFRPFQRGTLDLNTYEQHYGASAAARALLGDVRCILESAITSPPEDTDERQETGKVAPIGLGIPRAEFGGCSVILIVPDLFCKSDIKALTELLLVDMGFAQACIQQESVCATFGAGLSTGCVVDLGAEKISVSCVEEGLVLPETRVQLAYGGADLTRFLGELLARAKFPYRELDVRASIADTLLLDELKRRLLTLNPADVGLNIHDFYLRLPSRSTKKYLFRTYDELILAPMSLFDPSVYGLDAKSSLKRRQRAGYVEEEAEDGVAEDSPELSVVRGLDVPVTAAMTSCVKHLLPAEPTPAPAPAVSAPDMGAVASEAGTPAPSADDKPKPKAAAVALADAGSASAMGSRASSPGAKPEGADGSMLPSADASARPSPAPQNGTAVAAAGAVADEPAQPTGPAVPTIDIHREASKTGLDTAILHALLTCVAPSGSDDRLRKMAANVLCVGGSARIPGLGAALEARLAAMLAAHYAAVAGDAASAPKVTAIPPPREMDPQVLAWKGMSVFARLEAAASEAYVRREDWTLFGWRALKEKTLFL